MPFENSDWTRTLIPLACGRRQIKYPDASVHGGRDELEYILWDHDRRVSGEVEFQRAHDATVPFEDVSDVTTFYVPNLDNTVRRARSKICGGWIDGADVYGGIMCTSNHPNGMDFISRGNSGDLVHTQRRSRSEYDQLRSRWSQA